MPPEVIASPTKPVLVNLAPVAPSIVGFYGPAALALVLQHMAVTLIALSIVRERQSGSLDRFRTSPMRANEIVIGKVAAFGILGGGIAALSVVAPRLVPRRAAARGAGPARARDRAAARGLARAGTADIRGLRFLERQAVQLSLLTLLASMFFSGFVLRIEEFQPAVQAGAYALPVTHGITLMQELMLGGTIVHALAARRPRRHRGGAARLELVPAVARDAPRVTGRQAQDQDRGPRGAASAPRHGPHGLRRGRAGC